MCVCAEIVLRSSRAFVCGGEAFVETRLQESTHLRLELQHVGMDLGRESAAAKNERHECACEGCSCRKTTPVSIWAGGIVCALTRTFLLRCVEASSTAFCRGAEGSCTLRPVCADPLSDI